MVFSLKKNGENDHWKSDPLSPFKKERRRLFERLGASRERKLGLPLALWVVFTVTLGYVLAFSPIISIQTIEIPDSRAVDRERLRSIIEGRLDKPVGGIFPGRNFFLFPAEEIRSLLLREERLLYDVQVGRRFPHTIVLSYAERNRIVLYCEPGEHDDESCFGLDETTGIVGSTSVGWEEESRVPTYRIVARERSGISSGDMVIDPRVVAMMFAFEERLGRILGIECSPSAAVPTRFSEEVWVRSTAGVEYLLSLQVPVEAAVAALQTVYLKDLRPAEWERIEYVDLRTSGKAFYVLRDEGVERGDGPAVSGATDNRQ